MSEKLNGMNHSDADRTGVTEAWAPVRTALHVNSNEFCWVGRQGRTAVRLGLHVCAGGFPSPPRREMMAPGPLPSLLVPQTLSLPGSVSAESKTGHWAHSPVTSCVRTSI